MLVFNLQLYKIASVSDNLTIYLSLVNFNVLWWGGSHFLTIKKSFFENTESEIYVNMSKNW